MESLIKQRIYGGRIRKVTIKQHYGIYCIAIVSGIKSDNSGKITLVIEIT